MIGRQIVFGALAALAFYVAVIVLGAVVFAALR